MALNVMWYPVVWASKLQTEIALSVTEAEYIALSTAAREILPILSLAKEAANIGVIPKTQAPVLRCKIFEDNNGAVEMANVPRMRPRTKHLNIKYHFFRQFVQQGILSVRHIAGQKQLADVLTKALEFTTFARHRKEIMAKMHLLHLRYFLIYVTISRFTTELLSIFWNLFFDASWLAS